MKRGCDIPGCSRPHQARGLCHAHYQSLRRKGLLPDKAYRNDEERFWLKVDKDSAPGGCWIWTGATGHQGHGQFVKSRVKVQAHRHVYEDIYGGVIPDGLVLDHQCRIPACVNPAHLKPVTQKQNMENLGVQRNNKSGYRGVYKHSQYDRWVVNVNDNGRTVYGGVYEDLQEAAPAATDLRNTLYTNNVGDRRG